MFDTLRAQGGGPSLNQLLVKGPDRFLNNLASDIGRGEEVESIIADAVTNPVPEYLSDESFGRLQEWLRPMSLAVNTNHDVTNPETWDVQLPDTVVNREQETMLVKQEAVES